MTCVRISLLTTERREPFMMGKHDCSSAVVVRRLLLLAIFSGFYLSSKIKSMVFSSIQVKHNSSMQYASNVQFSTFFAYASGFSKLLNRWLLMVL